MANGKTTPSALSVTIAGIPALSSVDACEILPFFSPYCKPEGLSQKRKVVATEMATTRGSCG